MLKNQKSYCNCNLRTVQKTNMGFLKVGSLLNLERCLKIGVIDGHMVQGHVDDTVKCVKIVNENAGGIIWQQI